MTIRELRNLFFKQTGLYPPVNKPNDKSVDMKSQFASELTYIRWLENNFIDYMNSDMDSILQGRDLLKVSLNRNKETSIKSFNHYKDRDE